MITGRMVTSNFVLNAVPANIPGLINALPRHQIPQYAQLIIHPQTARSFVDGSVLSALPYLALFSLPSGGGALWYSTSGSSGTQIALPGSASHFAVFYLGAAAVVAHKVPIEFRGSFISL